MGAILVSKDQLFERADFLTIHLVLSSRTRGLVGAAELERMKPTARLINASRGSIVEEQAFDQRVEEQAGIASAAVDVFDIEPLPPSHPSSERWTTYWRRRISAMYRMVFTRCSTRTPSRIFGSGSTPISTTVSDPGKFVRTQQEQGKTMLKKLEGKIAVITGGTEGIGLATAKLFVKEGAYVFITGRRQKELDEAVKAIGTNVSGVQGDVANLADLDRLYETVSKVKGRIDIVFANAGVGEFVPFGAVTEEHFDKLFNINVRGTLFTVQKALPLLKDGGSIILNGSVASVKGTAAFGVYAASKAAIRSFVRT